MNGSLLLISCCHYNKKLAWDRRIRTMNKQSCPRAYVIEVDDNDLNVLFHLIYKLTRKQVEYKTFMSLHFFYVPCRNHKWGHRFTRTPLS